MVPVGLAGLDIDPPAIEAVVNGPIFARHAKLGGEFAEEATAMPPALEQEIGQVAQWLEMIARQAGLTIPARHTLF